MPLKNDSCLYEYAFQFWFCLLMNKATLVKQHVKYCYHCEVDMVQYSVECEFLYESFVKCSSASKLLQKNFLWTSQGHNSKHNSHP